MSKQFIALIIFTMFVIGVWVGSNYYFDTQDISPPAVDDTLLQPLDTNVDRSFVDDLQARADNRIGIELEL